jgi:hypothetical protein
MGASGEQMRWQQGGGALAEISELYPDPVLDYPVNPANLKSVSKQLQIFNGANFSAWCFARVADLPRAPCFAAGPPRVRHHAGVGGPAGCAQRWLDAAPLCESGAGRPGESIAALFRSAVAALYTGLQE